MSVRIIIGADIVPTKSNFELFVKAKVEELVDSKILNVLNNADYRIFNLEVPLTNNQTPIKKCGPNLIAPTETINGIKALGANLLGLANNHILDQGLDGFNSTIFTLKSNGIKYVGGGNLSEASKPFYFSIGDKTIGVYACAEHEFTIATEDKEGANPFEPLESLDHIAQMRSECDYVICLYHGGKEHYRYPSPYLQKVCRKFVEKGANLVLCQHTHCIGCEEVYHDGHIIYGQGNFLFDHQNNEYWATSLLIEVEFNECEKMGTIKYHPICKMGNSIRYATPSESKNIMDGFKLRSQQIKDEQFVIHEYEEFSKSMIGYYILTSHYFFNTIVFRAINRLTGNRLRNFIGKLLVRTCRYKMRNFIECEAHRELFLTGLNAK